MPSVDLIELLLTVKTSLYLTPASLLVSVESIDSQGLPYFRRPQNSLALRLHGVWKGERIAARHCQIDDQDQDRAKKDRAGSYRTQTDTPIIGCL